MAWYDRLLAPFRPDPLQAEIEREISFHLAERTDDLVAEGMSRGEALREARRRFGNQTL